MVNSSKHELLSRHHLTKVAFSAIYKSRDVFRARLRNLKLTELRIIYSLLAIAYEESARMTKTQIVRTRTDRQWKKQGSRKNHLMPMKDIPQLKD